MDMSLNNVHFHGQRLTAGIQKIQHPHHLANPILQPNLTIQVLPIALQVNLGIPYEPIKFPLILHKPIQLCMQFIILLDFFHIIARILIRILPRPQQIVQNIHLDLWDIVVARTHIL